MDKEDFNSDFRMIRADIDSALNNSFQGIYMLLNKLYIENKGLREKLSTLSKKENDLQKYVDTLKSHIQKVDEQNRLAKINKYKQNDNMAGL